MMKMIINRKLLAITACAFMALGAVTSAHAITLDEAVAIVLTSSERSGIVVQQAGAGRARARAGVSHLLPQLDLEGGYYKLGTNASPNPFFVEPDRDYNATLSVAQLLWAGGRITEGFKLKRTGINRADVSELMGMAAIRYRVAAMYYAVLFERARMQVLADRVKQSEQELEDSEAMGDEGLAAPLDIRQARQRLNMSREALLAAELKYRQVLVDFNIELGGDSLETMHTPEGDMTRPVTITADMKSLEGLVSIMQLPELKLSALKRQEAELKHRIARGARLPELSLVGSATSSGPDTSEMNESWMAGVNLSFHLYDGGLRAAGSMAAMRDRQVARLEDDRSLQLVRGRVYSMRMRADSVNERIALRSESVKMAASNYEDARAEYREGLITLTRLGEFNLAYVEARLGLIGLYLEEQRLQLEVKLLSGE